MDKLLNVENDNSGITPHLLNSGLSIIVKINFAGGFFSIGWETPWLARTWFIDVWASPVNFNREAKRARLGVRILGIELCCAWETDEHRALLLETWRMLVKPQKLINKEIEAALSKIKIRDIKNLITELENTVLQMEETQNGGA